MKLELMEELFNEFDKDKELIKKNLLHLINTIIIETKDEYGKLTLTIKYERNGESEANNNN